MNNKEQEKAEIKKILGENPKVNSSPEEAEKKFESHIGFTKEKKKFKDYVELYVETGGNFCPTKEIICYSGEPGTGKTTFVQTLNQAMGRGKLQIVPCAGIKKFNDYSILGDENKPSLAAWAIKQSGCKNPIILLDELEKIEDEQIQRDLIKLFDLYQNKEGEDKKEYKSKKLFDKYYQMEIELDHITFFATVNFPQDLVPLLKNGVVMRSIERCNEKDKTKILGLKKDKIKKNIKTICGEDKEIIPEKIIELLPKHIHEGGVRQAERALNKIEKEYIYSKEKGKEFSINNPQQWLKENILPYQDSFRIEWKHYFLFVLWGIIWILLLIAIVKKIILRKKIKQELTENE